MCRIVLRFYKVAALKESFGRAVGIGVCVFLAACQNPNEIALKIGAPPEQSLNLRAFESHAFDNADQASVLRAGLATFQDLGFNATETAPDVGVVAGEKARDAKETGQIVGAVIMGVLFGANAMQYDVAQQIHATFVVAPGAGPRQCEARISFDRYITNNKGMLRTVLVVDPKVYQEFYDKLQASLTLDAGKV